MFIRALLGAAIAAAIVFVWGYVYWVVLPFSSNVLHDVEAESGVIGSLQTNLPASGVYIIPGTAPEAAEAIDDWKKRAAQGPVATLFYRQDGVSAMSTKQFAFGYLQMFLAALAAAIALSASDVNFYPGRVMIVFWIGVFAVLWTTLSDVAWYYFPMNYFWLKLGYTIPAAILMGLVLAAFVKPPAVQKSRSF